MVYPRWTYFGFILCLGVILTFSLADTTVNFLIAHNQTIWEVDRNGHRQLRFAIESEISTDNLSEIESRFYERYEKEFQSLVPNFNAFDQGTLTQYITGIWSIDPDNTLLVMIQTRRCQYSVHSSPCVGYHRLHTLNLQSSQLSSPLITIDFHHPPLIEAWDCAQSSHILVDEVIPNPSSEQLIMLLQTDSLCANPLDRMLKWAIMLDYRDNVSRPTVIPASRGFSWSPEGERLVYLSYHHCAVIIQCQPKIMLYEGSSLTIIDPQNHYPDDYAQIFWILWQDNSTLIYARRSCPILHPDPTPYDCLENIIWHNIEQKTITQTLQTIIPDRAFNLGDYLLVTNEGDINTWEIIHNRLPLHYVASFDDLPTVLKVAMEWQHIYFYRVEDASLRLFYMDRNLQLNIVDFEFNATTGFFHSFDITESD